MVFKDGNFDTQLYMNIFVVVNIIDTEQSLNLS